MLTGIFNIRKTVHACAIHFVRVLYGDRGSLASTIAMSSTRKVSKTAGSTVLVSASGVLAGVLGEDLDVFRPRKSSVLEADRSDRCSLHDLAAMGNLDELSKRLPKISSYDANKVDQEGRTMLHCAVENEREAVVLLLAHASGCHLMLDASVQDNRKRTPLYLAVQSGRLSLVELLLKMTNKVDMPGPNDRTGLHVAALGGNADIVNLLIQNGANLLSRDREGTTPLGIITRAGSITILDKVFSYKGVPSTELLESTSGPDESSLLHLGVESGNVDIVLYLLSRNINRRTKDKEGLTAAHIASREGNVPALRQLIRADAWLCQACTDDGVTPVHMAAKYDQVAVLRFLREKGASFSALTSTGTSPLLIAASFGSSNAVRVLLSCDVDCMSVDKHGMNVLQCAVGNTKTLRILMEILKDKPYFEELVSSADNTGATALHYAAKYGDRSDVVTLLKHGSSLDAIDECGSTSLHLAAGRGHLHIVMKLSSYAPRLLNAVDGCGRTPLHIACLYRHTKVVVKLLEDGAAIMKDRDGRTPFHCAAWGGSIDCTRALMRVCPTDLNIADTEKATALHLAVVADHPDLVKFLLNQGAAVTDNEIGQNCLDVAITRGLQNCALAIVEHERWEQTMKPLNQNVRYDKQITQLQKMVEETPSAAMMVMDKCVVTSKDNVKENRDFNFSYMLGITNESAEIPVAASVRLLTSMVNLNRTQCLAHPLCVEFLNSKWRKFGAAVVIGNIVVYVIFLLLLTRYVIGFPAYTPHLLLHHDHLENLLELLPTAKAENRNSLNTFEKIVLCYGHPEQRQVLIVVAFLCLVKELLPLWYQGLRYFKRLSNNCECIVYGMTLVFLDPYEVLFYSFDVPHEACPKKVWEVAALTVFLSWIALLLNMRRLPHGGIYVMMMMSMVATMVQFLVVASLFVLAFGLAFHMILFNEASFVDGGLSLVKTFLMVIGDLDYESVLPTTVSEQHHNVSYLHTVLRSQYGEFKFVNDSFPIIENHGLEQAGCSNATGDVPISLVFPTLSYGGFILFALLMPIVVLNTLIGLAVGDIAAVQEQAALRQIRMQVKLLVELETALPSWFLSRVQVTHSSLSSQEGKSLRGWVRRAMNAAKEPAADEKSFAASQLAEIKGNLSVLQNWLVDINECLDKHLVVVKTLAACVRRQQMQAIALDVPIQQQRAVNTTASSTLAVDS